MLRTHRSAVCLHSSNFPWNRFISRVFWPGLFKLLSWMLELLKLNFLQPFFPWKKQLRGFAKQIFNKYLPSVNYSVGIFEIFWQWQAQFKSYFFKWSSIIWKFPKKPSHEIQQPLIFLTTKNDFMTYHFCFVSMCCTIFF